MIRKIQVVMLMIVFLLSYTTAHGAEEFDMAEQIIKQKISCAELTEEQFEILGDYFMEQMHSGEQHEIMDEKMGGEGSESLRQVHVSMGRAFYCGEHEMMPASMMNMMMGRGMYGGMMASAYSPGYNSGVLFINWLLIILILIALVLLIIFLLRKTFENDRKMKRR